MPHFFNLRGESCETYLILPNLRSFVKFNAMDLKLEIKLVKRFRQTSIHSHIQTYRRTHASLDLE